MFASANCPGRGLLYSASGQFKPSFWLEWGFWALQLCLLFSLTERNIAISLSIPNPTAVVVAPRCKITLITYSFNCKIILH